MDKSSLQSQETWDLIKWAGGILSAILFTLSRWFFGDIRDDLKNHEEKISKIETTLAEMDKKLASVEKIAEYLHAIKGATSFQDHIKRQTKKRKRELKRLEKKLA